MANNQIIVFVDLFRAAVTASRPGDAPDQSMCLATNIARRSGSAVYSARLGVPKDLQPIVGRQELWEILRNRDAREAKARVAAVLARWHGEFVDLALLVGLVVWGRNQPQRLTVAAPHNVCDARSAHGWQFSEQLARPARAEAGFSV